MQHYVGRMASSEEQTPFWKTGSVYCHKSYEQSVKLHINCSCRRLKNQPPSYNNKKGKSKESLSHRSDYTHLVFNCTLASLAHSISFYICTLFSKVIEILEVFNLPSFYTALVGSTWPMIQTAYWHHLRESKNPRTTTNKHCIQTRWKKTTTTWHKPGILQCKSSVCNEPSLIHYTFYSAHAGS